MIEFLSIDNPRFSTKDGSLIDADVKTVEYGVCACSFHADDQQDYLFKGERVTNSDIYRRAKAGEFGKVEE